MKFRKLFGIALISCMLLSGCKKNENEVIKIGISQFIQHPALDAAREGFIERLKEAGYEEGKNISIDYQNASGDIANSATIANQFSNDHKDLILGIATPSAQALAQTVKDVPILITAVTDPAEAGLVNSNEDVGGNITGTSDESPLKEQMKLIRFVVPYVKKVGIIYSSSEDNSKYIFREAKNILADMGIEVEEATVQNSNDIQAVVQNLVRKVDAIYTPTDNIISSGMSTISEIANKNKLPVIGAEEAQVRNGAVCTIGINYKELGKQTADMAVKILKGDKQAKDMPIEYLKKNTFESNKETAKILGIDIEKVRGKIENE